MLKLIRLFFVTIAIAAAVATAGPRGAWAGAAEIDRDVDEALRSLYAHSEAARTLSTRASAILVFPEVVKGGFLVGGQYGEGAMRINNRSVGYYSTTSVSYGLQAGVQKFGYALFLMNKEAIKYVDQSDGWELGVGPSIVVVDDGFARTLTTTTAQEGIYAFIFDQKGLMAGLGLQGSKIMKINPGR
jgi:lipid-binding SYLF domain-containing protein